MTVSILLLSFGVLLFISPIFTAGAPTPSRHSRSSSKIETCHLQILQAGTKVVEKLAENMFSYLQLQNNTLKQTPLLDGVCSFVVLYEVAKNTSVPLSQLLEQNIKDSCSFLSLNYTFEDYADCKGQLQNYCLQYSLTHFLKKTEKIIDIAQRKITSTTKSRIPSAPTKWIRSKQGDIPSVNCIPMFGENNCRNGTEEMEKRIDEGKLSICGP